MGTSALLVALAGSVAVAAVVVISLAWNRRRKRQPSLPDPRPWHEEREPTARIESEHADPRVASVGVGEPNLDVVLRRLVEVAAEDPRVDAAVARLDLPGSEPRLASVGLPPDAVAEELVGRPRRRRGHRAVKLSYLYGKDEPPGAIRAGVIAPLLSGSEQIGSLALYSLEDDGLSGLGVARVEALARTAGRTIAAATGAAPPDTGGESEALEGRDRLTGLGTRQHLVARLTRETLVARTDGLAVTLVMVDVQGLGALNERNGEFAGDCALTIVAQTLAGEAGTDNCFRVGGDEFAVVLLGTTVAEAAGLVVQVDLGLQLATAVGFNALGATYGMAERASDEDLAVTLRRATADLERAQRARDAVAAELLDDAGEAVDDGVYDLDARRRAGA